jgi:diguanylate cyclase (GGDEF)-like protein
MKQMAVRLEKVRAAGKYLERLFVILPEEDREEFRRETGLINVARGKVTALLILCVIILQTIVHTFYFANMVELLWEPPGLYYTFLFVPTAIMMVLSYFLFATIERKGADTEMIRVLEIGFTAFLLFWAVGTSMVDEMVFGHIVFYLICILAIGVIPLLEPLLLAAIFGSVHLTFFLALPYFSSSPGVTGHYIIPTAIMAMAWLISRMFYTNRWDDYINKKTINEKNRELVELNEKLSKLSTMDELTQVPNRRAFDRAFAREWEQRALTNGTLSLVLADIDNFKAFNDYYGHQEGDRCLREVAAALRESLFHEKDHLARYGGDEFAILLPDTSERGAMVVAERLRQNVAELAITHGHSETAGHVTISLGVCSGHPGKFASMEEFLNKADQALYQAKHSGRNCVVSSDAAGSADKKPSTGLINFPRRQT